MMLLFLATFYTNDISILHVYSSIHWLCYDLLFRYIGSSLAIYYLVNCDALMFCHLSNTVSDTISCLWQECTSTSGLISYWCGKGAWLRGRKTSPKLGPRNLVRKTIALNDEDSQGWAFQYVALYQIKSIKHYIFHTAKESLSSLINKIYQLSIFIRICNITWTYTRLGEIC